MDNQNDSFNFEKHMKAYELIPNMEFNNRMNPALINRSPFRLNCWNDLLDPT